MTQTLSPPPTQAPPVRREESPVAAVRRRSLPYALLLPAALALLVALGYPLVRQVVLSFQEYGLAQQFGRPATWIGLQNYIELFTDSYLWTVVVRSLVFCFVNAALTMAIGIAVALLLGQVARSVRILVQAGLLLAWAMPVLAGLTIWQWLFDSQYGVINYVLTNLGLDYAGHSWLLEPRSFFAVATVIVVWMSVPFVAFTVYAALTQLPGEILEAAEVDGAGAWARFRYVVIPTVKPVLMVVGLLQVIWDLRVFTQIYVLQKAGGVTSETNLLGTYIYRLGIGEGSFGKAAAVAMFMLLLTVVLTAGYVRSMLRQEEL